MNYYSNMNYYSDLQRKTQTNSNTSTDNFSVRYAYRWPFSNVFCLKYGDKQNGWFISNDNVFTIYEKGVKFLIPANEIDMVYITMPTLFDKGKIRLRLKTALKKTIYSTYQRETSSLVRIIIPSCKYEYERNDYEKAIYGSHYVGRSFFCISNNLKILIKNDKDAFLDFANLISVFAENGINMEAKGLRKLLRTAKKIAKK